MRSQVQEPQEEGTTKQRTREHVRQNQWPLILMDVPRCPLHKAMAISSWPAPVVSHNLVQPAKHHTAARDYPSAHLLLEALGILRPVLGHELTHIRLVPVKDGAGQVMQEVQVEWVVLLQCVGVPRSQHTTMQPYSGAACKTAPEASNSQMQ